MLIKKMDVLAHSLTHTNTATASEWLRAKLARMRRIRPVVSFLGVCLTFSLFSLSSEIFAFNIDSSSLDLLD